MFRNGKQSDGELRIRARRRGDLLGGGNWRRLDWWRTLPPAVPHASCQADFS